MPITWIFFDIGSTLVDETEAYDHRAREMLAATSVTFAEFDRKRSELARQGLDGNSAAVAFFGLQKTPWHSEDEVPFADAAATLAELTRRGYRLGVIANQNAGAEQRLAAWGLRDFFAVLATSDELGVAKPDRRIFTAALKMADCLPEQAVMVGDRLDNDLVPAKALGMRTVWMRKGTATLVPRCLGESVADDAVDCLADLLTLFPPKSVRTV